MEITIAKPDIYTIIIRSHGQSLKVYVETSEMGYNDNGRRQKQRPNQLTKLSKDVCAKVYHIKTSGELDDHWFNTQGLPVALKRRSG
jgi:4-hydroxy-3-methylbut-2-enyl diphosphate reductase IspH